MEYQQMIQKINKYVFIYLLFLSSVGSIYAATSKISFTADSVKAKVSKYKKTTNLIGNAVVKTDTLKIKADSIEIFGDDYQFVNASGSVNGEDTKNGYTFKADFIKFDRKTDVVLMFGKIELNDKKNNVQINAENVEYKKKAELMIMRFNVNIVRKDINCNSMFALYSRKFSSLELAGRPVVRKKGDEFRATKISIDLNTEDIVLDGRVSGSVEEKKGEENSNANIEDAEKNSSNDEKTEPEKAIDNLNTEKETDAQKTDADLKNEESDKSENQKTGADNTLKNKTDENSKKDKKNVQ